MNRTLCFKLLLLYAIFGLCPLTILANNTQFTYVFAHGIWATQYQVNHYRTHNILFEPFVSFDFPEVTTDILNYKEMSLGQDNEVACLHEVCEQTHKNSKTSSGQAANLILMGVDRGASTIINYMGTRNPDFVAALILESPFDSVTSVLDYFLKHMGIGWWRGATNAFQKITETICRKYRRNGLRPIDLIAKIANKDLPILILCSRGDMIIPWKSSYALYEKAKNEGFTHVHFIAFEYGGHVSLLDQQLSRTSYHNTVHAFYKLYDLPHDPESALKGLSLLKKE
jgi:hypothetical protein